MELCVRVRARRECGRRCARECLREIARGVRAQRVCLVCAREAGGGAPERCVRSARVECSVCAGCAGGVLGVHGKGTHEKGVHGTGTRGGVRLVWALIACACL